MPFPGQCGKRVAYGWWGEVEVVGKSGRPATLGSVPAPEVKEDLDLKRREAVEAGLVLPQRSNGMSDAFEGRRQP